MKARSPRIDTLRGIAVFGILLVNVWGFVHGTSAARYGVLGEGAAVLDQLAVFAVAAFAEQKFYPIFAFLFGAGFALQTGGRHADGPQLDAVKETYRRRVRWLLGCGLLHGALLWFGDILTVYAITAFWLLGQAGRRLSRIAATLRILVALNVLVLALFAWWMMSMSVEDMRAQLESGAGDFLVYTRGGFGDIARLRLGDFALALVNGVFFLPRVALLFLLGLFSVRLGLLTHPERHRAFWRRVLLVGLCVGLPLNLWWGVVALRDAIDPLAGGAAVALWSTVIDVAGTFLAAGYVAALMLASGPVLAALAPWFAPVGRMALTNYLMQSVLCVLLLQGVGLGLGALLPPAGLVGLCLAIMLGQVVFSRWWLRRRAQGPMEAMWRRYTRQE